MCRPIGLEVKLQEFLISALEGSDWQFAAWYTASDRIWADSRTGLKVMAKKSTGPNRESNSGRSARSQQAASYDDGIII
jgi:hypothetical protein